MFIFLFFLFHLLRLLLACSPVFIFIFEITVLKFIENSDHFLCGLVLNSHNLLTWVRQYILAVFFLDSLFSQKILSHQSIYFFEMFKHLVSCILRRRPLLNTSTFTKIWWLMPGMSAIQKKTVVVILIQGWSWLHGTKKT